MSETIRITLLQTIGDMKAYFLNGGLHVEPESDEESKALFVIASNLKFVGIVNEPLTSPVGDLGNEQPVLQVMQMGS